ncbi:MAG: hypothetical protein EG826_02880 [Deltaproteobacteria bacterium]|nr:hypothetical protein [Deltaproteobacteria bacterium]
MAKTVFDDTPPLGTIVTALLLNALNNHRHTGRDIDGDGAIDYAVATGSDGAYAVTLSPVLDAHIAGMPIRFKANHANTGAATIAINGLEAVAIKKNVNQALAAGDIQNGQIITIYYDGTNYQAYGLATGGGSFKMATFTRDLAGASENVAYTGAGFKPSLIIIFGYFTDSVYRVTLMGASDFNVSAAMVTANGLVNNPAGSQSNVVHAIIDNKGQSAVPVSSDADGCTLAWTKSGSPSAQTIYGTIIYIK